MLPTYLLGHVSRVQLDQQVKGCHPSFLQDALLFQQDPQWAGSTLSTLLALCEELGLSWRGAAHCLPGPPCCLPEASL